MTTKSITVTLSIEEAELVSQALLDLTTKIGREAGFNKTYDCNDLRHRKCHFLRNRIFTQMRMALSE